MCRCCTGELCGRSNKQRVKLYPTRNKRIILTEAHVQKFGLGSIRNCHFNLIITVSNPE